jgi:prolyl-tRNA synthetase
VPVRIEAGPKDLAKGQVVLVRRDDRSKQFVARAALADTLRQTLDTMQADLFQRALDRRTERTQRVEDYPAFTEYMAADRGFATAHWCGSPACETRVKDETKATIRTVPEGDFLREDGKCVVCGETSSRRVIWAKAY